MRRVEAKTGVAHDIGARLALTDRGRLMRDAGKPMLVPEIIDHQERETARCTT